VDELSRKTRAHADLLLLAFVEQLGISDREARRMRAEVIRCCESCVQLGREHERLPDSERSTKPYER
jgi:alkylhydroperoxidase family enzyme